MSDRAGHYLEESVSILFEKAGFKTKLNSHINSYEIDVLASKGDYKIAIECKQYERSHITIRNILHQWASKRSIVNVDKIVVVIAGQKPQEEDYKLAKQLDIVLMDNYEINRLNSFMDKEQLKSELNNLIRFDEKLYQQKRKKKIIRNSIIFGILALSVILLFIFNKDTTINLFVVAMAIFWIVLIISAKNRKRR